MNLTKYKNNNYSKGSAMVAVLVILTVAIVVTASLTQNVIVDSYMSLNIKKSNTAYNNAISAIEEATLRLLRNRNFTGTTLSYGDGNAIISIDGDNPKTVTVISKTNNNQYISKFEAIASFDIDGSLIIDNIVEIY